MLDGIAEDRGQPRNGGSLFAVAWSVAHWRTQPSLRTLLLRPRRSLNFAGIEDEAIAKAGLGEGFPAAFVSINHCQTSGHFSAGLPERRQGLQRRPAGCDRIVQHGGFEPRAESALDAFLHSVRLGLFANETPAQVDAMPVRGADNRVYDWNRGDGHSAHLYRSGSNNELKHQFTRQKGRSRQKHRSTAVQVVVRGLSGRERNLAFDIRFASQNVD